MESTGQPRQNFKSVCALRKATVVLYLVYGLHIKLILFGGALVDPSTSRLSQIWKWWQMQGDGQQNWPRGFGPRKHFNSPLEYCQKTEYHWLLNNYIPVLLHQRPLALHHPGKPMSSTAFGGFFALPPQVTSHRVIARRSPSAHLLQARRRT